MKSFLKKLLKRDETSRIEVGPIGEVSWKNRKPKELSTIKLCELRENDCFSFQYEDYCYGYDENGEAMISISEEQTLVVQCSGHRCVVVLMWKDGHCSPTIWPVYEDDGEPIELEVVILPKKWMQYGLLEYDDVMSGKYLKTGQ